MEVDLKKDSFHITYDPASVSPERMLETIRAQGFHGEVVKNASAMPHTAGTARRDLARLPEELRKEVKKAKQDSKPLLLAFLGPG